MKNYFKLSFAIIMFFCNLQQTFAWGLTGHRVVAQIAEQNLSKKTKKAIAGLIDNQSLSWIANWPDFIKSDTTGYWKKASSWHYINVDSNYSKEDFIKEINSQTIESAYNQLPVLIAQIKDKNLDRTKRQQALAFLIHIIGDIHQPMHVGRKSDLGGNKVTVYWFKVQTNLHSIWDDEFVQHQGYSYTEYANELQRTYAAKKDEFKTGLAQDWLYESYKLAGNIYARTPPESKLSYLYNYIFKDTLDTQLYKGGLRLAEVLNSIF
ncbi:S1/P1 nuclease [Polluticaenibacter yanchengensis]|uniref:S1/P1 nuclease n=1 Tax=Polluticaenibacter yanchengensis TaxID=3014562 RepID=A0ABT4UJ04_9BACT|nr:S1/P1 nuclease [Chitinophagaceae bacterium LY-5]